MTIAIFGNTLRSETLREVKHIIDLLQQRGVSIVLSQELRQEAYSREFPSVEDYVAQTGEPIDFALSLGVKNAFIQEGETQDLSFIPEFNSEGV